MGGSAWLGESNIKGAPGKKEVGKERRRRGGRGGGGKREEKGEREGEEREKKEEERRRRKERKGRRKRRKRGWRRRRRKEQGKRGKEKMEGEKEGVGRGGGLHCTHAWRFAHQAFSVSESQSFEPGLTREVSCLTHPGDCVRLYHCVLVG